MVEKSDVTVILVVKKLSSNNIIDDIKRYIYNTNIIVVIPVEYKNIFNDLESIEYYDFRILNEIEIIKKVIVKVNTKYVLKLIDDIALLDKVDFLKLNEEKINIFDNFIDPIKYTEIFNLETNMMLLKTDEFEKWITYSTNSESFTEGQNYGILWAKYKYKISPLIKYRKDINYVDFLFWKDIIKDDFTFIGFKNNVEEKITNFINKSSRKQFLVLLINRILRRFS